MVQLREKGPDSADVATVRVALARAYVELGEPTCALEPGEQALAFYAKYPDPHEGGELRWVLARALHATGSDRARAGRAGPRRSGQDPRGARVAEVDRLLGELRR